MFRVGASATRISHPGNALLSGINISERIAANEMSMASAILNPDLVMGLSVYLFLMTPVTNTISRTMEFEADMYGLNAARQPDGEANVDMMLGEYRKLDLGPAEEFVLFDHPSGRTASPLPCGGVLHL